MKKIVMFLMFCCGIIGNSWAVCELTESTDLTPSDEDLYPQDPNVSRMALICEKGKCEDGEIVLAKHGHYRKKTQPDGWRAYQCKHGVNDRWVEVEEKSLIKILPECDSCSDKDFIVNIGETSMTYGVNTKEFGFVTCQKTFPKMCDVKCMQMTRGKYVYCDALYKCDFDYKDKYFFDDDAMWDVVSCDYSNPFTRNVGRFTVKVRGFISDYQVFGVEPVNNGDKFEDLSNFCLGCRDGLYSTGIRACVDDLEQAWCKWRKSKDGKNVEWVDDNHCECKDSGMEWNIEQHDCVKSGKGGKTGGKTGASIGGGKTGGKTGASIGGGKTGGKTGNKTGANTGKVNKTCAEMYPGNSEAIACCEFGKNGGAEWKDNKCNCTGENKKWEYSDNIKAGHCVDDKKTEEKPEKKPEVKNNNIDCVVELGASVQCKNGTKFNKNATVSLSAEKCNLYKSNVAKYLNEIAGLLCEKSGGVGNIITDAQVKAATDNINRFFEYAESNANVWKNSEGKFNTARLASDATAGVILGTVGGIVSAKIIKKKQVEKGFDALNCTVGGQKVADFGDEFTIGFGK